MHHSAARLRHQRRRPFFCTVECRPGAFRRALQKLFVLAVLTTPPAVGVGFAHPAQETEPGTATISLGAVSSSPKGQVMIPLFLTPGGPKAQVGSFSAAIRFPKNSLTFVRAEKGFLLDSVNATFHAEVADDAAHPDQSLVQLEVSTKGATPRPLREGLVLSLVFRIQAEAKPDTTATLEFDRVTATAPGSPSSEVKPVATRQGTVEILRPDATPYVGCFFFTH